MSQTVFLGIVVETDNLAALRTWASEKSIEPPIIRPLVAGTRSAPRPNVNLEAAAHRVFTYWTEECRHPRAVPGNRLAAVKARLRERMALSDATLETAEADLRLAIDGAAKHPTINEKTQKPYNDLELICRNASKVEDFMSRADRGEADQRSQLRRFAA